MQRVDEVAALFVSQSSIPPSALVLVGNDPTSVGRHRIGPATGRALTRWGHPARGARVAAVHIARHPRHVAGLRDCWARGPYRHVALLVVPHRGDVAASLEPVLDAGRQRGAGTVTLVVPVETRLGARTAHVQVALDLADVGDVQVVFSH